MNSGDRVVIRKNNYPLYKFTGIVIGRRGFRIVRDTILLSLVNKHPRSYLISEFMVSLIPDSALNVETNQRFN